VRRYTSAPQERRYLIAFVRQLDLDNTGEAVQVEPMKPMLKAPGTERLKLKYDNLVSRFAFKFNLRRYTPAPSPTSSWQPRCACTTSPS
jgi:hypothetical protein